jgi:hypothetical protein
MPQQTIACTLAALLFSAVAVAEEPDAGGAPARTPIVSAPPQGGDPGDVAQQLNSSRGLFLEMDMGAAAARIRQASTNLRATARDEAAQAKESLTGAAEELEILGQRVEARTVKTVEELDRPFARAFHALAQHHYLRGQQYWQLREAKPAGHRLRAAADNLERAVASTGQRLNASAAEAVNQSRQVSGKLIHGAGYATDEVGRAFENIGKHVEAAGDNFESATTRKPDANAPR